MLRETFYFTNICTLVRTLHCHTNLYVIYFTNDNYTVTVTLLVGVKESEFEKKIGVVHTISCLL